MEGGVMSRVRIVAIIGIVLLLVAAALSAGALAARRPPVDLGPVIVVPAGPTTTPESTGHMSPPTAPTPGSIPAVSGTPSTPTAPPAATVPASEAVRVSK